MPLSKRIICDPFTYSHADLYEGSAPQQVLEDTRFSKTIGAIQQLGYLSSYAFEIFDGLTLLTEDVNDRINAATSRTCKLVDMIASVEKRVMSYELRNGHSGKKTKKYLKNREAFIPTIITRSTSTVQVSSQYAICQPPPSLWKIETIVGYECMQFYSNPGLFFEEWLRVELARQELLKMEKKRSKALKKMLKMERRERRKRGEDWQSLTKRGQREMQKSPKPRKTILMEGPRSRASSPLSVKYGDESMLSANTSEGPSPIAGDSPNFLSTPATVAVPASSPRALAGLFGFMKVGKNLDDTFPNESLVGEDLPQEQETPIEAPPPLIQPVSAAGHKAKRALQGLSAIRSVNVSSKKSKPTRPVSTDLTDHTDNVDSNRESEGLVSKSGSKMSKLFGVSDFSETSLPRSQSASKLLAEAEDDDDPPPPDDYADPAFRPSQDLTNEKRKDDSTVGMDVRVAFDIPEGVTLNRWSTPHGTNRRKSLSLSGIKHHTDIKSLINSATQSAASDKPTHKLLASRRPSSMGLHLLRPQNSKPSGAPIAINRQPISLLDDSVPEVDEEDEEDHLLSHIPRSSSHGEHSAHDSVRRTGGLVSFGEPTEDAAARDTWSRLMGGSSRTDSISERHSDSYRESLSRSDARDSLNEITLADELVDEMSHGLPSENEDEPPDDVVDHEDNDEDDLPPPPPQPQSSLQPIDDDESINSSTHSSKQASVKPPPPPPPPPKPPLPKSVLSAAGVLGAIKDGATPSLRRAPEIVKVVDARATMLSAIKSGGAALRRTDEAPVEAPKKAQNHAIAAILANRAAIAGSDSESESDSDSDFSDDDY